MIFAAKQLQEKCWEQDLNLYATFIELTKAFNTISCNKLWKIMSNFGCPNKFVAMMRQFHDGMQASVYNDGEHLAYSPVTNSVKKSCVFTPTLFGMVFTGKGWR